MQVDKRNGNVMYNDLAHLYWDDSDRKYVSVTTLIGKFGQEFDKEFWSAYKALEKLLTKEEFKAEKKHLLETKKIDKQYFLDMYEFTENDFNKAQQDILDDWQKRNQESCERGTKIHADLEHALTGKKTTDMKKYGLGGKFQVNTNETLENNNIKLLDIDKGVFPEYLISRVSDDGKFRIAGQIDLLIKDGNDIYIIDYKGLPLDTKIPTKTGWSTIRDLCIGDEIFDKNGNITKILHKSEVHYNPCYKITFDNGDSIIADHEHRWEVAFRKPGYKKDDSNKYKFQVMTTEEISDYLESLDNKTCYDIPKIINSKPLNLENKELPLDPYVFGAWLGDGSKACGIITQAKNSPLWDEIQRRGYKIGENLVHDPERDGTEMRTIIGIRGILSSLNVLNNKHIPDIYQRASYEQRLDLLRGLMDTDGYYNTKRKRFVMSTGQEWQKDDMVKLLSTFGIKSTVFEVVRKCNNKTFQAWDVCFSSLTINPFLIRNQNLQEIKVDKCTFRNITSVELVDTVPTQCLEVDSPTHTFLCTEKMIVTHNTNKSLDDKSYFDSKTKSYQMMKYPLNNLMDCNKVHYALQLSTYAWMLQKINPEFNIKMLKLIHYDHDGNVSEHELNYLKQDVIRMCNWYKKQSLIEENKAKRKPIVF